MSGSINNAEWLAGYRAYERGEGCPWGDFSASEGWRTAKADAAKVLPTDRQTAVYRQAADGPGGDPFEGLA